MSVQSKIVSEADFVSQIQRWKDEKQTVVFTNGCFDILHLGHVDYLEKARNFGDKLVIGLNSDDSVTKLKGAGRPINDQFARSRILAAMEFVDLITLFFEDTPHRLIGLVKPDVLVKGGDYQETEIVGSEVVRENGGTVKTIPIVQGFSTTELIEKISD